MRVVVLLLMLCGSSIARSVTNVTNEEILGRLRDYSETMKEVLSERWTNLHVFLATNLEERLINVEEMVKGIADRQKLYHFCTPGVCGEHGECYIPDDTDDDFACDCAEHWKGQFCNEIGPCHAELQGQQAEFPMLGEVVPRCDEDGYYAGMQYSGSKAICVTKDGVPIKPHFGVPYIIPRWEAGENMTCECARDEFDHYSGTYEPFEYICTENGNYPDE